LSSHVCGLGAPAESRALTGAVGRSFPDLGDDPLTCVLGSEILKQMLNSQPQLDLVFQALSDPTRRAMVERLGRGPASVTQLAEPFAMSLPAVLQHVAVLETSGLVRSEKVGRVRTCQIDSRTLSVAGRWIQQRRTTWERRLDRLGAVLAEQPG